MPLNAVTTTARFEDTVLSKPGAVRFTVMVGNQTVLYQLNVPPFGNGENWLPIGGAQLVPGTWTFDPADWAEFGTERAQGIRFKALDITDPAVVTVS